MSLLVLLKTVLSKVSGIHSSNEQNSAGEIASMALEVVEKMKNSGIEHRGKPLVVRIGVHTGKSFLFYFTKVLISRIVT
jgi:hypothetical protein